MVCMSGLPESLKFSTIFPPGKPGTNFLFQPQRWGFFTLYRRNFKQIGRKETQVDLANIERVNLNKALKAKVISFKKSEKPKLIGPQRPCQAWDCS
jgi:hypothetical protein